MSENISYVFVERLYKLSKTDFSNSTIIQAKRCLLDYIGVALAGSKILEDKCLKYLNYLDEPGNSTIIGIDRKSNIQDAILFNGMNSHVAELDDGIRYGVLHPGSPIISALLSVAEKENISNNDLLKGIIIGYEAAICIGHAIQPSHYSRGYHPTSTCGTIGAALGIASMLNYSLNEMIDTLAASSLSAYGTLKVIEDGSELKPYNSGRAALNGFTAACLARSGFKGDKDPLSGDSGFLSMMSTRFDKNSLLGDDQQLGIKKIYFKPYASCRHTHPGIEAALFIKKKSNLDIKDIKQITIKTYEGVIGKHDFNIVPNPAAAKMSIPFSVAIALKTGKAGLTDFNIRNVEDKDIISLSNKITVVSDKEITKLVPHKRAAEVLIKTNSEQTLTHRVDLPKGEPENPMTNKELEDKFTQLAMFKGMDKGKIDSISKDIMNIENSSIKLFEIL